MLDEPYTMSPETPLDDVTSRWALSALPARFTLDPAATAAGVSAWFAHGDDRAGRRSDRAFGHAAGE